MPKHQGSVNATLPSQVQTLHHFPWQPRFSPAQLSGPYLWSDPLLVLSPGVPAPCAWASRWDGFPSNAMGNAMGMSQTKNVILTMWLLRHLKVIWLTTNMQQLVATVCTAKRSFEGEWKCAQDVVKQQMWGRKLGSWEAIWRDGKLIFQYISTTYQASPAASRS